MSCRSRERQCEPRGASAGALARREDRQLRVRSARLAACVDSGTFLLTAESFLVGPAGGGSPLQPQAVLWVLRQNLLLLSHTCPICQCGLVPWIRTFPLEPGNVLTCEAGPAMQTCTVDTSARRLQAHVAVVQRWLCVPFLGEST
jgi:hypothetical protein